MPYLLQNNCYRYIYNNHWNIEDNNHAETREYSSDYYIQFFKVYVYLQYTKNLTAKIICVGQPHFHSMVL